MKFGRRLFFLIMALGLLVMSSANFYTNYLWYLSIGYQAIFLKTLLARTAVFAVALVAATLFFVINLHMLRTTMRHRIVGSAAGNIRYFPSEQPWMETFDAILGSKKITLLILGIALALGAVVALPASSGGLSALLYLNSQATGVVDPLYQADVSFYLFRLPFLVSTVSAAFGLILMTTLVTVGLYVVTNNLTLNRGSSNHAVKHTSLLVFLLLLVRGVGYRLDAYRLVYSPRGVAFGASYTDVAATRPIFMILLALSVIGAVVALVNLKLKRVRLLAVIPALILVLSVVAGSVYPMIVQQYVVEPNELERETLYIKHNIDATRRAFGLDALKTSELPAPQSLTQQDVANNQSTLANVRVLDWRPLQQTYSQLQSIRVYYRFHDVDIDRYMIDGKLKQVMLAARELSTQDLSGSARTWINEHIRYTHGYGAVVSPVNRVSPRGEPLFYVQDIPPRTTISALRVDRPEIYFGEFPGDYVIVNALSNEFSYPLGESNATTRYEGDDGITLNLLNKLMFSIRYSTTKLFLADDVRPDSKIMLYRNILERLQMIAPFLTYEPDPYLVINEGRLFWIIDAYTTSTHYPYSEPYGNSRVNYIRNSVKVIVDAYNGTVTYYLVDEVDPIAATLASTFPSLFQPLTAMPDGLRAHIRYPEQLLAIQANVLSTYHMTNPSTFYNKEDLWRIAQEQYAGVDATVMPYYMVMTPPGVGAASEEFVLVLPLTPAGTQQNPKHNMVAYLAARNDYPNYGELILYRFPKDTVIQGPMQVESRISQDALISQQITLWSAAGSNVLRGNLLVIPLGNSLIYVEPLYIQSTSSSLPELKRVIVATLDNIAMAETFEQTLAQLVGIAPPTGPTEPTIPGIDLTLSQLAEALERAYQSAQGALQRGDWAEYGRQQQELSRLIQELQRLGRP